MNKVIFILIDFDNVFKKRMGDYSLQEFELMIKDMIRDVLSLNKAPSEIRIRFYGGWYKDDMLSSKGSSLQQIISSIQIFPIIKGDQLIRGNIQLATSLYSFPNYIWTNTFKEKEGIPRLRINLGGLPEWCEQNKDQCPVFSLNRFTASKEKPCHHSHCEIKNSNAFIGIEQKMVDTMISCDLISFSQEPEVQSVCLFSDDLDLLPPLGYSSLFKNEKNPALQVQLFIKNERQVNLIKQLLSPFDVKINAYE